MTDRHSCVHRAPAGLTLRAANPADAAVLCDLVRELAGFEGLTQECAITPEAVAEHLLGPRRCAAALIAEIDGQPAGFAVYYRTFSTFAAKPGIFLEDLYVRPAFRQRGLGRALLSAVAQIAHGRSSGRLEWCTQKWNEPALKLYDSIGARRMEDWTLLRLLPGAIAQLAGPCTPRAMAGCGCGGAGAPHRPMKDEL